MCMANPKPLQENPMPSAPPARVIAVKLRPRVKESLSAYLRRTASSKRICRDAFGQFNPATELPPLRSEDDRGSY